MVQVIRINTEGDFVKAVATLNRAKHTLPRMTILGMHRWGKILERHMKRAAKNAGIADYSGLLMGKGIEYRQGPRSENGYLFIRLHGVYLDSMKPHYVSVKRSRTTLLGWAAHARSGSIQTKAMLVQLGRMKRFSIYVKPHPFIATGYRTARPKLRPVLKRIAARAIAS